MVVAPRPKDALYDGPSLAQGLNQPRRKRTRDGSLVKPIDEDLTELPDYATKSGILFFVRPCPFRKLPGPVDDLAVVDLDLVAIL